MISREITIETRSAEETEALGKALAPLAPLGSLVALYGELGAGKTCFVRGLASHYGRAELVSSPTFTIVNEYGADPKLYHVDLYRMDNLEEIIALGHEEIFEAEDGVTIVEWAGRAEGILPQKRLDIFLAHEDENSRTIRFCDLGLLREGWRECLSEGLENARGEG